MPAGKWCAGRTGAGQDNEYIVSEKVLPFIIRGNTDIITTHRALFDDDLLSFSRAFFIA